MNVFEYIQSMQNANNIVIGIGGLAILGLFLLVIVLKMLGGMRRGIWRQLIRTGVTFAAAAISYFVAVYLSNHIIGCLKVENFDGLISTADSYLPGAGEAIRNVFATINTELIEYIILVPATLIIIPIIATLLFLAINLVLKIVRAIIIKIAGFKKSSNNAERLGGALLAAVEGIIWMIMVTLPISAILGLVGQVYETATTTPERAAFTREVEEEEENISFVELYQEYVAPFTENPASAFIQQIGANAIADGIATVTVDGRSTNMRSEVVAVTDVVVEATKLTEADFTALNETQKQSVTNIVATLADSTFMSKVLVGTLNTVPTIYESGLIPLDAISETPVSGLVDTVMDFLEETTTDTLTDDLSTLTEAYFGLCDSGVISAVTQGEDVMEAFKEGSEKVLDAVNALSSNERTESIVDSMYDVVLNAAFSGSSAPSNPDEEYGDNDNVQGDLGTSNPMPNITIQQVKDGISQIAGIEKNDKTDEEYINELAAAIIDVAKDKLNVEFEEDMALEAAKFINDNLSEEMEKLENVTKDKIKFNELVFALLDAYQSFNDGEDIDVEKFEDILDIEISDKIDEILPEE